MATTRQYFNALRTFRNNLAVMLGTDPTTAPQDVRALANANLAATAVLVKALTDAHVITDAQLQAAANGGTGTDGSTWDPELTTDQVVSTLPPMP